MTAKKFLKKEAAFTLIELLVVIVIISILAIFLFVAFTQVQKGARDQQRKSDLQVVAGALQRFYSDHNYYPVDNESGKIALYVNTFGTLCALDWGKAFTDFTTTATLCTDTNITYLRQLPVAPSYTYYYKAFAGNNFATDDENAGGCKPNIPQACQHYAIWSYLEANPTNTPGCAQNANTNPDGGGYSYTAKYNYVICE